MTTDAVELANAAINHFRTKADHNKLESLFFFFIIVTFSLLSPMFVMLGDGLIVGKIIPSCLSLVVAASTAWLQLRKLQHLWAIYRDSQRKIEDVLCRYQFNLGEFSVDEVEKTRLLADSTRAISWEAHTRWLPLVPNPESVTRSESERIS